MQHNDEPGTWLARDGDGQVLEVDAAGYPGAEASSLDDGLVVEACCLGADPEAWQESYRATVAGLQQRNRVYLAARVRDLEAEAG